MLRRALHFAVVRPAAAVPHWLVLAGGAFLGGAMGVLQQQAPVVPVLEALARGDSKGAEVLALHALAGAAVGGLTALYGLAKAQLPAWLQPVVTPPVVGEQPPQV